LRVELICLGDELLDGRTRDLNANWLGAALNRMGLLLARITVAGDDQNEIVAVLREVTSRAELVVVSGGLGPTEDDRTRHAVAQWLDTDLIEDSVLFARLEQLFAVRGYVLTPNNRQQALFPRGSEILATEVGTAPGFRIRQGARVLDVVPGVPREFQWFMTRHTLPLFAQHAQPAVFRTWKFFGLGESALAQKLDGLDVAGGTLHYTAKLPEIHVFVRMAGDNGGERLERVGAEILERLGSYLIAVDDESLPQRLGRRLQEKQYTLATAESCTGGQIGEALTSVSGSSAYYLEGFITYSNQAKMARLGVQEKTLNALGAVSAETAVEMALGVRQQSGATIGLSATGIAGPTGGTPDKPVGTVHLGMATPSGVFYRTLNLLGRDRDDIRTLTTWSSLAMLLWYLEDRLPEKLVRRVA
jgi:nicotinamide-nucleotide amidase